MFFKIQSSMITYGERKFDSRSIFQIDKHQPEGIGTFIIRISDINKFCQEFFGLDTLPSPLECNLENEDIRVNTIIQTENGYIMTARIMQTLCKKIMAVVSADADPYSSLCSINLGQPVAPLNSETCKFNPQLQ